MELSFAPIRLEDKKWIEPLVRRGNERGCEYSFASNYVWSRYYAFEVAEAGGYFLLSSNRDIRAYLCPTGGEDIRLPIEAILLDCGKRQTPFYMYSISAEKKAEIEAAFPGKFTFEPRRDTFEYIYERESLATLAGKKLHAKRNHIHAFEQSGGRYLPLTPDRISDCIEMNRLWCADQECDWNPDKEEESCITISLLRNYEALGLTGGLLELDGKVVAFTLGEQLSEDTFVVHAEKAFAHVRGAYPYINREFVRAAVNCRYVNREEDAGDEGLRQAKLSYQPVFLLEKYDAVLKGQEHLL